MKLAENSSLSDFTKKTLEQFGWKDGDAIPADLGELLISFRDTIPPSKNVDVLVDATLLTDEQTQRVKNMLAEAQVASKEQEKLAAIRKKTANANIDPSAQALYEKIMTQKAEIIDDREINQPADTPADEKPTEPEPVVEPPAATAVEVPPAAERVEPFCPRCGWDMKQKFEVVPTDKDKEDFLIATLGGQRFRKTYELFGGKVLVTFRSMLADENKAIYRQLVADQVSKKIATEAEWFVQMMDYRLACSLDEITSNTGKVAAALPELKLVLPLPEDDAVNPLVRQLNLVNKDVLAQEVTRRLVGTHLRKFQRLIEALEAMALEPSFWNGIE
jgi:hypothetical protein